MKNINMIIMLNKKILNILDIIIIFIIGMILRIVTLFQNRDFWHDESFTYLFSNKSLLFIISSNDVHPPFFYILTKFWQLFSSNIIFLRSISLLFYIGFFIMLYLLLKEQFDKITQRIILIFISLSPTFIFYSLEYRNYCLSCLLVVTQIYFFFEILSNHDKKYNYYLYTLFSILCLYCHYYTAFVLLVEVIYLLKHYSYKSNNKTHFSYRLYFFIKPFFFIGTLSIPLIVYFLTTLTKMQSMWFKEIDFGSFISTTTYQFIFPEMFTPSTIYIFIIMFVSLISIFFYFRMLPLTKFYLSLFYFPVILLWGISQFTPVYHHRFFLFYAFGLYIVIAKGISYLFNSRKLIYVGIILFSLFLSVLFNGIMLYDSVQNKELYKSQLELKDYLDETESYIFIHESTFSMSPMKVYFEDYNNVKHYLINNLTRKQLFTAGGSVVNDNEIINSERLYIFRKNNNNKIIYFTHNTNIKGEVINAIYNDGGLLIYER